MSESHGADAERARTSRFFDRYAGEFDAIYGNRNTPWNALTNHFFRVSMRERYRLTLLGCSPAAGRSVLDVGTGPGHYAVALAKAGASQVLGIDFAEGMLERAREHAGSQGVADQCRFEQADFLTFEPGAIFDYTILMGFMDYMSDPEAVIRKALSLTRRRAFFSFPLAGGLLGWQRQLRYRGRCELYLYTEQQVVGLFARMPHSRLEITPCARDLFVTAHMEG